MRRFRIKNNNTINYKLFIVFFLIIIITILLVNKYGSSMSEKIITVSSEKIDKIVYQSFSELITNNILDKENLNNLLIITKNNKDEILTVDYDLKSTYEILNDITNMLKNKINDLENGNIDIKLYDKYIESGKNGLVLYIPLFINSNNIFINNIGPRIPVLIKFNETILTNVKTKVTNYGFNNALLEIYINIEMQKTIISPVKKDDNKLNYEVLIGALVINGSVPNYYGGVYENSSNIFDIPKD